MVFAPATCSFLFMVVLAFIGGAILIGGLMGARRQDRPNRRLRSWEYVCSNPQCRRRNPPEARFCGGCGRPLVDPNARGDSADADNGSSSSRKE